MNSQAPSQKTDRVQAVTLKEEVPFDIKELFFSRTDERGVILTGNEVFQRIAQYPWDRLIRAPHRVIRHPEMPRAEFWILWDHIKSGRPVGAYVKNLAEDGRYYWVFAVVTPIEGGYLSVRLKPSSPLLSIVANEYAALRKLEIADDLDPKESAERLLARIQELGFRDYQHFMAHALSEEFLSRDTVMGRPQSLEVRDFNKLLGIGTRMIDEANQIAVNYNSNRFVAMNMRVRAARMGRDGKTVGVISNDYGIHSQAMLAQMDSFADRAKKLAQTVAEGCFLFTTSLLQREAIAQFSKEVNLPAVIDKEIEQDFLNEQLKYYEARAKDEIMNVSFGMNNFSRRTAEMQRLVSGLDVTRVMGMIECAHLRDKGKALLDVLNDLDDFQRGVSNILSRIDDANQDLFATIRQLESST